jgi:hypothetical protein
MMTLQERELTILLVLIDNYCEKGFAAFEAGSFEAIDKRTIL